ncbi:hypothetical protein ACIP88_03940, partial [Streptomyces uncialis]
MSGEWSNPAYVPVYEMLLELEKRLDALRHVGHADGIDPRGTTALHAVRLAAAILQPVVPGTEPPPFPDDTGPPAAADRQLARRRSRPRRVRPRRPRPAGHPRRPGQPARVG